MEIIDRTFRIYRNNFLAFAGLVALVILPLSLLSSSIESEPVTYEEGDTWEEYSDATQDRALTVGAIGLLEQFLLAVVVNAAITFIASENLLGRRIPILKAFGQIKGRLLPLGGGCLMVAILFVVLIVIIGVLADACILPVLLLPFLLYYGLALYFFLVPVIVLERAGPGLGTNRAQYLGRVRFWPTLGFAFVIWLVMLIIRSALGSAGLLVGSATFEGASTLNTVLSLAVSIFILPIMPIGLTLMYYDARIRVEGLDFALQSVDSPEPRPSDVDSPYPAARLITGRDIVNTILLTILVIAVGCGLVVLLGLLFSVAV
jgi:hypothetical protein